MPMWPCWWRFGISFDLWDDLRHKGLASDQFIMDPSDVQGVSGQIFCASTEIGFSTEQAVKVDP